MGNLVGKLVGMGLVAAIFVPLERRFALHPGRKLLRAGWKTDTLHFVLSHGLSELISVIPIGLAIALTDPLVSPRLEELIAAQPRALQLLEAVFIVELTGYWSHRAMHAVPFLWRIHSVHHSSRELDWLAAVRVHPMDQVLGRTLGFVALRLLGFGPAMTGGALVIVVLWAIFLHANVRFRFPRLERFLATPAFHHWHHANDAEARHCNFAGLFPFVDRLFGTLHLPKDEWPQSYGTDDVVPDGYLEQLRYPVRASPPPSSSGHPSE